MPLPGRIQNPASGTGWQVGYHAVWAVGACARLEVPSENACSFKILEY